MTSLVSWVALRVFVLDVLFVRVFFLYRNVVVCLRALISAAVDWNDFPFGVRRKPWLSLALKFRVSVRTIPLDPHSKFSLLPVSVTLHAFP